MLLRLSSPSCSIISKDLPFALMHSMKLDLRSRDILACDCESHESHLMTTDSWIFPYRQLESITLVSLVQSSK